MREERLLFSNGSRVVAMTSGGGTEELGPISDMFVCRPDCPVCEGDGIVCEDHPMTPWRPDIERHSRDDGTICRAAGMPCPAMHA